MARPGPWISRLCGPTSTRRVDGRWALHDTLSHSFTLGTPRTHRPTGPSQTGVKTQRVLKDTRRLFVEFRNDMRVRVQCLADPRVAEALLDDFGVQTVGEPSCSHRVAKAVKPHLRQPGALQ